MITLNIPKNQVQNNIAPAEVQNLSATPREIMNSLAKKQFGDGVEVIKAANNMKAIASVIVGIKTDISKIPALKIFPDWNNKPQSIAGKYLVGLMQQNDRYTYMVVANL